MDIENIYSDISRSAVCEIEGIDGKKQWLRTTASADIGTFDIAVFRGRAIEKASIARITLEVTKKAAGQGKALTAMHIEGLQINIYPSNPLLPVALLNLERRQSASGIRLAGYLSIFPMNKKEDTTGRIQDALASIIVSMGINKDRALKDYSELWRELDWPFTGEQGMGLKISGNDTDLDTIKNAFMSLAKNFLCNVAEKKAMPFSEEDETNMFSFRLKLTDFILAKDLSTKICLENGVRFETLSSLILPPVVRFKKKLHCSYGKKTF